MRQNWKESPDFTSRGLVNCTGRRCFLKQLLEVVVLHPGCVSGISGAGTQGRLHGERALKGACKSTGWIALLDGEREGIPCLFPFVIQSCLAGWPSVLTHRLHTISRLFFQMTSLKFLPENLVIELAHWEGDGTHPMWGHGPVPWLQEGTALTPQC